MYMLLQAKYREAYNAFDCSQRYYDSAQKIFSACDSIPQNSLLLWLSGAAFLLGLLPFLLSICSARLAGDDRNSLARILRPAILASLISLALALAADAANLVVGLVYADDANLGLPTWIVVVLALGLVIACYVTIKEIFGFSRNLADDTDGLLISPHELPQVRALVSELSLALGIPAPDNLIIGLEPNFFATHASIRLPDGTVCRGTSLFLSATLLRVLSLAEARAVIGHELAHFSGQDTLYSMQFAPVYRALTRVHQALQFEGQSNLWIALAKMPAIVTVGSLLEAFSKIERAIARLRELEADRMGARFSGAGAAVSALVKSFIASGVWHATREEVEERDDQNLRTADISLAFADMFLRLDRDSVATSLTPEVLVSRTAHPFDTHPTLQERAQALGIQVGADVVLSALAVGKSNLLDDGNDVLHALTAQYYAAHFAAPPVSARP